MSDNILEVLRDYRPPKKLHPIAGKAYDMYDAAGFKLTDEAKEVIRQELDSHGDDLAIRLQD